MKFSACDACNKSQLCMIITIILYLDKPVRVCTLIRYKLVAVVWGTQTELGASRECSVVRESAVICCLDNVIKM